METVEFIRLLIAGVRRQTDEAMKDMTLEQFNWTPPGPANSISGIFVHFLNSEDAFIQAQIQGKPRLWEAGGWSAKTGVALPPGYSGGWEEIKLLGVPLVPVLAFQQVVRAATDAYLETLTSAELDRVIQSPRGDRSVAATLIILANHAVLHSGEIAALKTIQQRKQPPA